MEGWRRWRVERWGSGRGENGGGGRGWKRKWDTQITGGEEEKRGVWSLKWGESMAPIKHCSRPQQSADVSMWTTTQCRDLDGKKENPQSYWMKKLQKNLLLYSFVTPDFLFHGHFIHWWIAYQKNQIFHYRMSQKRFKALISCCTVFKKKVPIILLIIIRVVCFIILRLSVCAVNASVHIMSPTLLQIPPLTGLLIK